MKSFKEFLAEANLPVNSLKDHMQKLGYKFLGRGIDQMVFGKPSEDTVIKIFGGEETGVNSHNMAIKWLQYCEARKGNIFLPKKLAWDSFVLDGVKCLQIRMERLYPLKKDVAIALQDFFAYHMVNKNEIYKQNIKDKFFNGSLDINDATEDDGVNKLSILLGKSDFDLLLQTVENIAHMGRSNGWGIDLHKGNFMQRKDGTPVIVDPFTAD